VTLNVQEKAEGQVMQVPLASLYDAGKGPASGAFPRSRQRSHGSR
jgi:hypothetical protein